jgi:hypothetical protein
VRLEFGPAAIAELSRLQADAGLSKRLKAVRAALGKMEADLRRAGLNTHKYKGKPCPHGLDLFEAYAQNKTPGAYRIFFCYPPGQAGVIFIVDIVDHP